MLNHRSFVFVVKLSLVCLFAVACQDAQFRNREAGALVGAGMGAGLGAIVGNQFGSPGAGVAIGSAFGALSGAALGHSADVQQDGLAETEGRLQANERELMENRRLLDQLKSKGIDARISDRGVVANLPDVLFEFNSSRLNSDSRASVRQIAGIAQSEGRGRIISVEGHTDSVGSDSYNLGLSKERANRVADELVAEGVSPASLRVRGFGKDRPVVSNSTASGRQRNRRVEVIIENR